MDSTQTQTLRLQISKLSENLFNFVYSNATQPQQPYTLTHSWMDGQAEG